MPFLPTYEGFDSDMRRRQRRAPGQAIAMQQTRPALSKPAPQPQPNAGGPARVGPSGQHVNFDQYMRANQGAAQASAGQMAGGIAAQGQAALGGLAQQQAAFNAQTQANQTGAGATYGGPTGLHDVGRGPGRAQSLEQTSGPVARGGQMSRGLQAQQSQSVMPQPVGDYGALRQQALEAQRAAEVTGQRGGVESTLRAGHGGGYSGGESAFDAALTGAAGRDRFNDLRQTYGGILDRFTDAERAAGQTGAEAAAGYAPPVSRELAYGPEASLGDPRLSGRGGDTGHRLTDRSGGQFDMADPNNLSDEQLNAQGYMYSQAPGESYAHYSDRVAGRGQGVG